MIEHAVPEANLHELIETFFRVEFATDNALITEAVKRMLAAGGKRLRPRIALLAAQAGGADPAKHLHIAAYMELIHVATLIHDDVVDNAQTRRGINATAVDYGNRISVLAGDYLFAWIFKNVTAGYPHPIPHILSATLADICDGEVLQLRALGNLDLPLDPYLDIALKKTGSLFAASAQCGAIAAGAPAGTRAALRDFGENFGVAFQMKDDLLDMTADAAVLGKPVGNDLGERKVTIPLILALRTPDSDFRRLVERFFADGAGEDIPLIVARVEAAGGFARTREQIARYVERAKTALAALAPSAATSELAHVADALLIENEEGAPHVQ